MHSNYFSLKKPAVTSSLWLQHAQKRLPRHGRAGRKDHGERLPAPISSGYSSHQTERPCTTILLFPAPGPHHTCLPERQPPDRTWARPGPCFWRWPAASRWTRFFAWWRRPLPPGRTWPCAASGCWSKPSRASAPAAAISMIAVTIVSACGWQPVPGAPAWTGMSGPLWMASTAVFPWAWARWGSSPSQAPPIMWTPSARTWTG